MDSTHGLLTTVAYQLGPQSPPVYALEGSIAIAGALIKWLKDNMKILSNVKDCESAAEQSPNDNRIVFVPAFTGLYAPYWRKDARRSVFFCTVMMGFLIIIQKIFDVCEKKML